MCIHKMCQGNIMCGQAQARQFLLAALEALFATMRYINWHLHYIYIGQIFNNGITFAT